MKIYRLTISTSYYSNVLTGLGQLGGAISCYPSNPHPITKQENYLSIEKCIARQKEIEDAVTKIGLIPSLVSVHREEFEVNE